MVLSIGLAELRSGTEPTVRSRVQRPVGGVPLSSYR